jgi:predicted alpha/beta-fold hydrolase
MPSTESTYRAPTWLPGGHLQTIYPYLLPRAPVAYRRERLATPDGDFVDVDWLDAPAAVGAPVVVTLHGLEGDSRSHYALALMRIAAARGWRGAVAHWRGCSGELNRRPRAYHSGDHAETGWLVEALAQRSRGAPVLVVGVSLGGSALLNWLGRAGALARDRIAAAAAVSAPIDLLAAGRAIDIGANRIYARHFLSTLVPKALDIARRHAGLLDVARIRAARSMRAFDDAVTAPLHGFADALDYWTRASSKPWLARIELPTLVLNGRNDPFIPGQSLPHPGDVGPGVVLEQPADGGHVGFYARESSPDAGWLPTRLLDFFEAVLRGREPR